MHCAYLWLHPPSHPYGLRWTPSCSAVPCLLKAEAGFDAVRPQWGDEVYEQHVALPYVQEWSKLGKEIGYKLWNS